VNSTPPGSFSSGTLSPGIRLRPATTADIRPIRELIEPLVEKRILLGKELVMLYEAVQEFVVAEQDGQLVGCGALHVFWENLGEVRTLAVSDSVKGHGVGGAILDALEHRARSLGLTSLFCLTFEVEFFRGHGYEEVTNSIVDTDVYVELVRSRDEGVAEFLDLARVKPNTLGNSRMLKQLD
jgi:amino-acid N-acetyltransferase